MLIVLYPLFHHLLSIAIRMQNHTFFNTYMNSWQFNTALGNSPQFWTEAWAQQKHAAPSHVNIFYPQNVRVGSNFPVNSIVSSRFRSSSSSSVFSALVRFAKRKSETSVIVCCPLYCGPSGDIFAESEKSEIRVCQGLLSIDPRNSAGCKFAPCQRQGQKCAALPSRRNHNGGATNSQTLLKERSKRQSNAADGRRGGPVVGRRRGRRGCTGRCRRPANRSQSAAAER